MKVRTNENPSKLTFKKEVVTSLLEYIVFILSFIYYLRTLLFGYYCEYQLLQCFEYFRKQYLKILRQSSLNEKLKLIGGAVKVYSKKLLGHGILRCLVPWATNYFLKNMGNPPAPPTKCVMYTLLYSVSINKCLVMEFFTVKVSQNLNLM